MRPPHKSSLKTSGYLLSNPSGQVGRLEGFFCRDAFPLSFINIEPYRRLRSKSGKVCIFHDETQYFVIT